MKKIKKNIKKNLVGKILFIILGAYIGYARLCSPKFDCLSKEKRIEKYLYGLVNRTPTDAHS